MALIFHPMVLAILMSIGLGFLVAFLTGLTIGRDKGRLYPGGSLCVGLFVSLTIRGGLPFMFLCGGGGLAGWVIYRILFPAEESSNSSNSSSSNNSGSNNSSNS